MNIVLINRDMPCKVRALSCPNDDGSYTIIINSRHSWEQQKASVLHELTHIQGNDFDANLHADLLERMAHKKDNPGLEDIQFFGAG